MPDAAKTEQDRIAVELSRDLVSDLAPHELPLFPAVSRTFLQNRGKRHDRPGERELAFGAGEAVQMLSPVILAVVSGAVGFICEEVAKSVAEKSPEAIESAVRALLGRASVAMTAEQTDLTRLSSQQVSKLRQMVFDHATGLDLAPERANVLADSVAGKLLLADK